MKISQLALLCEISGASFEITKDSDTKFIGKFTTRNNVTIVTSWFNCYPFEESLENAIGHEERYWEFEFGTSNGNDNDLSYEPTNSNNDQMEIFANLLSFCQNFKQRYHPKIVVAAFKQPSQQKAYTRLLKRVWPEFDFDIVMDHSIGHHFIVGKPRV